MTLQPLALLIQTAKNRDLLAMHTHEGWILQDTTSCPRCIADAAVLAAARQFLLASQSPP